jgi:hypothetical protein
MFLNLKMRVEPYMVNLSWKRFLKDANYQKEHLIFMKFGVRSYIIKKILKNKNFDA